MKTTRKRYSADSKAKIALEAIRGDLTLAEFAAKHGVRLSRSVIFQGSTSSGGSLGALRQARDLRH
jgi:transposase-like protein